MVQTTDRSPQGFPLMDLPAEIIHKIVTDYQYTSKDLAAVRLVCQQMDDYVKPVALHSLNLAHKGRWTLEQMALIPNAFEDATRVVLLGRTLSTSVESQKILQSAICRVLKKLKHVHTVYWDLSYCTLPPSDKVSCVYEAVSQLPSLEKLVLTQMNARSFPDIDPRNLGQKFANAKLTSISVGSGKGLVGTVAVDNLRALIGAQPGLEEFISYNHNDYANFFDFAAVVGDAPLQEGFRPSLRTLHGANLKIAPSPNVLKYLANLTSLCISNLLPDHDALWPAFHDSDITLRTLVIERPTERLTDYLTGYRGLENLVITRQGSGTRVGVTDNTKHRFLEEGIAHHSNSLSTLQISFDPYLYAHYLLWGLDQRQLAWLEGFPKLEVLTVPFVHDAARVPKGTKISMEDALNRIFTRLTPTLRQVELVCGMSEDYKKHAGRILDFGIIRGVRNFEFSTRPRNPSEAQLKLFDATWLICYKHGRGKYHFLPKFTAGEE